MTREEYISDIKISLGAPTVKIEADDDVIGQLVDKAFREISRFITETRYVTVPYSKTGIDVSSYKINTVISLLRTNNPSRVADITDVYALASLNNSNSTSTNLLLSDYMYRTQMNQLKSTISTDLDFTYDKDENILYVNTFYPTPDRVTIIYIPEFRDVSDVTEQFWINYIQRLSLAFVKEVVGRIRSKYDLSSSLYKLDGGNLVSEGITERDAVRQELNDNSDLAFPID